MAVVIRPPFWVPRPSDDFIAPVSLLPPPAATLYLVKRATVSTLAPFYVPRPSDDFISPISLLSPPAATPYLVSTIKVRVQTLAPMYVPRPWDDYPWAPIAETLNVPQSLLKAPLPPFKAVNWARGYDDPGPYLLSQSQQSNTISLLTQGGQPPTKRWLPSYTLDDPAVWSGSPLDADTLTPLLTAGGKPPVTEWSPLTTQDDPAVWSGSPLNADTLYMLVEKGRPFHTFWSFYQQDDATVWQRTTYRNMVELAVPLVPLTGRFYGYDDPAVWSGSPLNAKLIRDLTAAGQPPTKVYSFYPSDDASTWQATIYRSLGMATLTPEPTIAKISRFVSYDDPAVWSGSPLNADTLYMLVEKGPPFFKAWAPLTTIDDPAVWSGSPLNADTLYMLVEGGKPFFKSWSFDVNDDPAVWSGSPLNADTLYMLVEKGPPVIPDIGRFWGYDDPAVWSGSPLRSEIIVDLTAGGQPPTLVFRYNSLDDPSVWQPTIYPNRVAVTPQPAPTVPLLGRFVSYDDASVWQATIYLNQAVQIKPPAPTVPLISRFASYDDPAVWYASPLPSYTLPMLIRGGPPTVPLIDRFVSYDDAAFWQATTYRDMTLLVAPFVPLIERFVSYDDAAFWQGAPYGAHSLSVPPTPLLPRVWIFGPAGSFQQDDAAAWTGRPLGSVAMDMLAGKPFSVTYQTGAVQGNYDVGETQWQFSPPYLLALITALPKPPFNNQSTFFVTGAFAFNADDAAFWVWVPPRAWSMILPVPPVQPTTFLRPTPYSSFHNFGKMGSS